MGKTNEKGTDNTLRVNAVMFIEAIILNGYKGV